MTPAFSSAVETHFINQMNASAYSAVPRYFENMPPPDTVDTFVALYIIAGDTTQQCINETSGSRNVGIIQIEVFTPVDQGAGEARNIAFTAGKMFKRLSLPVALEGVARFREPSVTNRGQVRGRHKHMVTIPYFYDFT